MELVNQVDAGELDMAVIIRPPFSLHSDLRWTPLAHEPFRLIVPRHIEVDHWRELIARHVDYTTSPCGQRVLEGWTELRASFVKVMPRDYKRVLLAEAKARAESREPGFAELVGTGAY